MMSAIIGMIVLGIICEVIYEVKNSKIETTSNVKPVQEDPEKIKKLKDFLGSRKVERI